MLAAESMINKVEVALSSVHSLLNPRNVELVSCINKMGRLRLGFLVRRPICFVTQKEKIKSKQCLFAVKEVR